MKRAYILSAIGVAIAVVLAVSEVRAVDSFPTEPFDAERDCTTPDGLVRIVAGPDADGEPFAPFPRVVTCPDDVYCPKQHVPLVGEYLVWEYEFTHAVKPSHAFLSVGSDMEILASWPSAWVSSPGEGDSVTGVGEYMYGSRVLRFNANDTTYTARYFTKLGIAPRAAMGGYHSGKKQGYCAVQGAGTTVLEQGQAAADTKSFQLPGTPCVVEYKVVPNGKVVPGSMRLVAGDPADCEITENPDPIEVDGNPVEYVDAMAWLEGGSCKYCWTNTYGGASCCECTGCCIKKGTTKCIHPTTGAKCDKCKAASKPSPCPY